MINATPEPRYRVARLVVALGLALALLACGCGYQLLRHADGAAATVAIVTLGNDSTEPGVELLVTRELRREFLRRGAPRLVSNPARADIVIRGRVQPLQTANHSFDTVALAVEFKVRMALSLDVVDADGKAVEIDRAALSESELYLASADVEAGRKNRKEALRRIADVLAGRIHDALDLTLAEPHRSGQRSGQEHREQSGQGERS